MPQQTRTILAVVLSMLVIFVYYTWLAPSPKPLQKSQADIQKDESNQMQVNQDSKLLELGISSKNSTLPLATGGKDELAILNLPLSSPSQEIVVENKDMEGVLTTNGGFFKSWSLKEFHQAADSEGANQPIDLLNHSQGGKAFLLTLGYTDHDSKPLYSIKEKILSEDQNNIDLLWSSADLIVEKKFISHQDENSHQLDIVIEIENKGSSDIVLNPRLWISRKQKEKKEGGKFFSFIKGPADQYNPMYYGDGKFHAENNWDKMAETNNRRGKIYWTGIADRYFLMSLIARYGTEDLSIEYGRSKDDRIYTSMSYGEVQLKPGERITRQFSAYLGPKKRAELKKIGSYLESSVDYGWFSFVAIPLLWLLIFFQKIVGNWGLAIIILTFLVKILLHPINKKSMESMKAMQKLQPRMKEIREKYKDQKEKLNVELMGLFKTHKVNPMGGCLPMVLQIPVYIALYRVLWSAVELYQAPFFWVYKDLSAPDPFLVTPVLLGIMMALQQKLTPQAATIDPAQQKVMMIMPIMFSAFMIFFPFGLVLYILVNTIMTVLQQYMIHQDMSFLDLGKKVYSKFSKSKA